MGCDIHGWVEWRRDKRDWWWGTIKIDMWIERSYQSFGRVFGVRRGSPEVAMAYNRGLPDKYSEEVKTDYKEWEADAHSASYISLQELKKIDLSELNEDWEKLLEAMELISKLKETKEVRLVVWFDN